MIYKIINDKEIIIFQSEEVKKKIISIGFHTNKFENQKKQIPRETFTNIHLIKIES